MGKQDAGLFWARMSTYYCLIISETTYVVETRHDRYETQGPRTWSFTTVPISTEVLELFSTQATGKVYIWPENQIIKLQEEFQKFSIATAIRTEFRSSSTVYNSTKFISSIAPRRGKGRTQSWQTDPDCPKPKIQGRIRNFSLAMAMCAPVPKKQLCVQFYPIKQKKNRRRKNYSLDKPIHIAP
jgi:hypothetical protein